MVFFTRRARDAITPAAAADVGLTADDGFDSLGFHRVVERDGAEHVAVIGHGARGHAQFRDPLGQWLNLDGAIQQTVVGMKMQVYEFIVGHYVARNGAQVSVGNETTNQMLRGNAIYL